MRKIIQVMLLALVAGKCFAMDASISISGIQFSANGSDSITVNVSGSDGFHKTYKFEGSTADIYINEINNGIDGEYSYDATAIRSVGTEYTSASNGREAGKTRNVVESETSSGHFRLQDGSIVVSEETEG